MYKSGHIFSTEQRRTRGISGRQLGGIASICNWERYFFLYRERESFVAQSQSRLVFFSGKRRFSSVRRIRRYAFHSAASYKERREAFGSNERICSLAQSSRNGVFRVYLIFAECVFLFVKYVSMFILNTSTKLPHCTFFTKLLSLHAIFIHTFTLYSPQKGTRQTVSIATL